MESVFQKWVDDADGVVVLSGVEVFRQEFGTACGGGCGEDGGIPIRSLVAFLDVEGILHDLHGEWDDAVAQPVLDERGGLLVGQGVGAGGTGGLNVEFL